jgi:anti-sigma-K factor RskA
LNDSSHIREENLELYALGALPEAEAAAVKAHVAGCRECGGKLAAALGNVAMVALAAEQEKPAAAVKEKLFARIAAERGAAAMPTTQAAGGREIIREVKRPRDRWWNWVLVPATVVLAVFCAELYRENRTLTGEVREARRVAVEFEKERLRVMGLVNALSARDTQTIRLASTKDGIPGSDAVVRYNKRLGKVLYTAELPALPPEKVYQMWLVPANGAPISAGTFTAVGPKRAEPWEADVPANSEPKAFAVTVEPVGGVPKPTGKIILLGGG